jgi:hypothetical protein
VLGNRPTVGRFDDECFATPPDRRTRCDDVKAGAVAIGREEAERLAVGVLSLADLLGKADGSERTTDAELLILGDRGTFSRFSEPPRRGDGLGQIGAGLLVDLDAGGDVVGVIADPALRDRVARGGFDQNGVGDNL